MEHPENEHIERSKLANSWQTPQAKTLRPYKILVFVLVLVAIAISIFLFNRSGKATPAPRAAAIPIPREEKKDAYSSGSLGTLEFVSPVTLKPILIKVEWRRYKDEKIGPTKETKYLVCYDPLEKTVVKELKLGPNDSFTNNIELRTFSNQRSYLISSQEIYEFDAATLELKLLNKEIFADLPKLQNGLKSLKFTPDGDGLELVTSEEELIYYFPIINQSYTAAGYEKAAHGFATLLPGAKKTTYHHFTQSKNEYSGYKLQLLKITYLDNGAGPKTFQKFFQWTKSYVVGQGYVICMVIPDLKEYRRITDFKDLTPGRNYYEPRVVYEDEKALLIRFKANATNDAPYKLQRLNSNTGEVIWTAPLPHGEDIKKLYRYKNGYYAFTANGLDLFDLDGTSIDHFNN